MGGITGSSKKKTDEFTIEIPKKGKLEKIELVELPKVEGLALPKKPHARAQEEKKARELESLSGKSHFDIDALYDMSKYSDRFRFHLSRVNPLLFFTPEERIKQAQKELAAYKARLEASGNLGGKVHMTPEEIDKMIQNGNIVGTAVHPDTRKIIPFYMRLSGFVPFNAPLVFAVLFVRNQSPVFNATMQWLNQTYNAAINYGNRNASSNYTVSDLMKGYTGAVAVSVSIALCTRTIFAPQLASLRGPKLIIANAFLNYIASASAGASNLALMRWKEVKEGIQVQNEKGDVTYGTSKKAGQKAIAETAFSRVVLPLPVLFFPAIGNFVLESVSLWPKNPHAGKFIEMTLCMCSLTFALPMSIALFKQRAVLDRADIDEDLKYLKIDDFKRVDQVDYMAKSDAREKAKKELMKKGKQKQATQESTTDSEKETEDDTKQYVQRFYFNKGL